MPALTKLQRKKLDRRLFKLTALVQSMRMYVDTLGDPKREFDAHLTSCYLHDALAKAKDLAEDVSEITLSTI